MLNAWTDSEDSMEIYIVDFHDIFTVPLPFLQGIAETGCGHLCLLPPYREHLSQAFARFFMRVGLPTDITLA